MLSSSEQPQSLLTSDPDHHPLFLIFRTTGFLIYMAPGVLQPRSVKQRMRTIIENGNVRNQVTLTTGALSYVQPSTKFKREENCQQPRTSEGKCGRRLSDMGTCYSVAYTWYAWMVGSQVTSAGMLRYRNEPVDGETTIEFQHLVDADEELLELGHGNQPVSLITDDERRQLQSGRYDEILVHNTQMDAATSSKTKEEEDDLRLEEEAYYEAKREAARAARQAQALEATRAAAATAAAAQATQAAMTQHADVFSSSPLQPTPVPATHPAPTPAPVPAPASPSPSSAVRQAPSLDADAQLEAFSRTAQGPVLGATSSGGSPSLLRAATSGQSTSAAGEAATAQARPSPPAMTTAVTSSQGVDSAASSASLSVDDQPESEQVRGTERAASSSERVTADVTSWIDEVDTSVRADTTAAGGDYAIMDEDDEEDFDSFLESVKAKNFGPDVQAKEAETARRSSPPPLENGDEEFTAFEESLS